MTSNVPKQPQMCEMPDWRAPDLFGTLRPHKNAAVGVGNRTRDIALDNRTPLSPIDRGRQFARASALASTPPARSREQIV